MIKKSDCENLLRVEIESKLSFNEHVRDLRKKENRKLRALEQTMPCINLKKKKKK